jgi:hypothetical protein
VEDKTPTEEPETPNMLSTMATSNMTRGKYQTGVIPTSLKMDVADFFEVAPERSLACSIE